MATSGHQNEGDNTTSDTWFAEQVTPTVFRERSGKACNGFQLWAEDVDLAASLGMTAYRFSVEWARVEPTAGVVSEEALDHYEGVVDRCLQRGMAPVVTFNHFTSPHWFAKNGGWLDGQAPAHFARYCERVARRFGDRIAYAITLNEPNLGSAPDLDASARLRARSRARHAVGGLHGSGRRSVPAGQRDPSRGAG